MNTDETDLRGSERKKKKNRASDFICLFNPLKSVSSVFIRVQFFRFFSWRIILSATPSAGSSVHCPPAPRCPSALVLPSDSPAPCPPSPRLDRWFRAARVPIAAWPIVLSVLTAVRFVDGRRRSQPSSAPTSTRRGFHRVPVASC